MGIWHRIREALPSSICRLLNMWPLMLRSTLSRKMEAYRDMWFFNVEESNHRIRVAESAAQFYEVLANEQCKRFDLAQKSIYAKHTAELAYWQQKLAFALDELKRPYFIHAGDPAMEDDAGFIFQWLISVEELRRYTRCDILEPIAIEVCKKLYHDLCREAAKLQ